MSEQKTYLELSEGDSGSHKFYEVTVNDLEVSIRYGRIGDRGQTKVSTFATPEKALADATKKINEKKRKGYGLAIMGERQKRSVTRRSGAIAESYNQSRKGRRSPIIQAPVVWRFDTGASALGIYIKDDLCFVGNQAGKISAITHDGKVQIQYKLPDGVKCILADDDWLYAGCDDGNVYDLSGKLPRVAYAIADNVDIFWIDVKDGILAVSDAAGYVTVINHDDESQWSKKSAGDRGWMVRCDEIGVYHGYNNGVTMYDWEDGTEIWSHQVNGLVGFGWQEESSIFASTTTGNVHRFSKKGDVEAVYRCDAYLCSCATAENGKYVFAGDTYGAIYCFNEAGDRLWKLDSGCGASQSMQFFKDHLYIVTHLGFLACIDASEAAILAAQSGTVTETVNIKASTLEDILPSATVETTSDSSQGVLVECFQDGNKLRIRVISDGYNQNWKVQFPRDIREAGARYLVDEIRESSNGSFYRTFGDIKRLV